MEEAAARRPANPVIAKARDTRRTRSELERRFAHSATASTHATEMARPAREKVLRTVNSIPAANTTDRAVSIRVSVRSQSAQINRRGRIRLTYDGTVLE